MSQFGHPAKLSDVKEFKINSSDGVIRWGILGCGDVTEVKSGPAFRKIAGSTLKAVMRRDVEKARDYAQRHGVPRWYGKAEDLLTDPEIDAVYVASPPAVHLELAQQVANAGKPCYVEKPMGASSLDAQRMIEIFAQAELPLFPAYYRRGLRKFRRMGELLAQDTLGKIEKVYYHHVSASHLNNKDWRLDPKISGGGLFVDLGSHVLDLLDFWFGPLELSSAVAENKSGRGKVPDHVQARLMTKAQSRIELDFDFSSSDEPGERMTITGEKGTVSFAVFNLDPLKWEKGETPSGSTNENFSAEHVQQGLLENVMNCLNGKSQPWATPQAALRTWKLMEAVLKNGQS